MSVLFCEEILARVFSQDQVNATRCKKALAEKEAQDAQSPAHTRGHTKTVSHRHFLMYLLCFTKVLSSLSFAISYRNTGND